MTDRTNLDDPTETPAADLFEGDPRTVRLRLDAGEELPGHRHPGTTVVCCLLAGELDLALDGETHALREGDVVRFDGDREIAPRAVSDSTALLVFVPE